MTNSEITPAAFHHSRLLPSSSLAGKTVYAPTPQVSNFQGAALLSSTGIRLSTVSIVGRRYMYDNKAFRDNLDLKSFGN